MDTVKSFNSELSALYDVKPPISKAKMTAITRGAIKAIKFYKHVVQSVEKFILKCKPEYKVPGLYVIDSIVRQSRHQFGGEKDVFAPRFAKNMQQTFVNLFKCPPEDKSKIIRVLNLWQKNQVFAPEVIQPLFDLADPNNPIHKELGTPLLQQSNGMAVAKGSPALQKTPTKGLPTQGNEAHGTGTVNLSDPMLVAQLQRFFQRGGDNAVKDPVHFDKKLLDFDYGDDDDEVNPSPRPPTDSVQSLLSNPEVIRHLQTIQQGMQVGGHGPEMDMDKMRKLQEMKQQEDEFDKHLAQTVPNLPFAAECEFKPGNPGAMMPPFFLPPGQDLSLPPPGYKNTTVLPPEYEHLQQNNNGNLAFEPPPGISNNAPGEVEVITLDHDDSRSPSPDDRYRDRRRRSRSRDRSRDRRDRDRDRRRRSRSRSKGRRHRSRSRDRNSRKDKDKEREKESEKDKERKKRGLPSIKKDNLSVCSTTLWVGHLSKLVHQEDLSNTFGEFGDVVSIDLIPPRGCAFIVMLRRQDAARCLNKLKNHVLHGKAITLAWAPGKGVKGKDLKDYWESDLGVSYIPFNKIKADIDLEMLEDGGMIDEDTMPDWLRLKMAAMTAARNPNAPNPYLMDVVAGGSTPQVDTSQPPPMASSQGLLQPPLLPLVSTFQFNNRLLGMNVPGMMPNIPIGVPPPSMPPAMMPNSLLGLNAPFQAAASLMQHLQDKPQQHKGPESLLGQAFNMVPPLGLAGHDDNMDIEMEDADKPEKPIPLSEQLQASMMNQYGRDGNRGRRRSRSRDRDNHRDRDRRSRDRERRDNSRGSGGAGGPPGAGPNMRNDNRRRDDRRDRPNRWGERDNNTNGRREPPDLRENPEERREREKTLNDRLREMAGMSDAAPVNPPPISIPPRQRNNSEGSTGIPNRHFNPDMLGPEEALGLGGDDLYMREFRPPIQDDFGPLLDYDYPQRPLMRQPDDYPERMHMLDGPDPLDGYMLDRMHPDDFRRGARGRDFRDEFPPHMDYFAPPRDDFGPRGPPPMMRSDFGPRMMHGGPRGGPRFGPRGPRHMGPRGPRFDNFAPRFDGPPEFFRGGRFEGPRLRHRSPMGPPGNPFDERRRPIDFPNDQEAPPVVDRERRSRWADSEAPEENNGGEGIVEEPSDDHPIIQQVDDEPKEGGGGTPLHDECSVPGEPEPIAISEHLDEAPIAESAPVEQSEEAAPVVEEAQ